MKSNLVLINRNLELFFDKLISFPGLNLLRRRLYDFAISSQNVSYRWYILKTQVTSGEFVPDFNCSAVNCLFPSLFSESIIHTFTCSRLSQLFPEKKEKGGGFYAELQCWCAANSGYVMVFPAQRDPVRGGRCSSFEKAMCIKPAFQGICKCRRNYKNVTVKYSITRWQYLQVLGTHARWECVQYTVQAHQHWDTNTVKTFDISLAKYTQNICHSTNIESLTAKQAWSRWRLTHTVRVTMTTLSSLHELSAPGT